MLGDKACAHAPLDDPHAPPAAAETVRVDRLSLEPRTFQLGRFTVILREEYRQWLYSIYLRGVRIGKSVSMPDLDTCEFVDRQRRELAMYAIQYALPPARSAIRPSAKPAVIKRRVGRPTGSKTQQDIAKALAGG